MGLVALSLVIFCRDTCAIYHCTASTKRLERSKGSVKSNEIVKGAKVGEAGNFVRSKVFKASICLSQIDYST